MDGVGESGRINMLTNLPSPSQLRASKNIIYATRNWGVALMGDPCLLDDHKVELSCLEGQHLQALYYYCVAQGQGWVKKEGSTSS